MAEEGKDNPVVLIAIDESKQSMHAFNWYHENMHQDGSRLLLVHVSEAPGVTAQQTSYMSRDLWEQLMTKEKERVKKLEEKYGDLMRRKSLQGIIRGIFHSRPGEALIEVAKKEKVNQIVMGTRGLGTIRRTILGSVSDYVLHHAHCTVTICRQPPPGTDVEVVVVDFTVVTFNGSSTDDLIKVHVQQSL